jgi:hypothetical protein
MDRFVANYLESMEHELTLSNALALESGDLSVFRVNPFEVTCGQGVFRYAARAFAQRGKKVFFLAYDTQQYGVGRFDPEGEGAVLEADQFLSPEAALKRFLSDESGES